jgi:hypothetical protein
MADRYFSLSALPLRRAAIVVSGTLAAWRGKSGHRPTSAEGYPHVRTLSRLWTWTMNAIANSGVARLTMGIETKAAMNRPAT